MVINTASYRVIRLWNWCCSTADEEIYDGVTPTPEQRCQAEKVEPDSSSTKSSSSSSYPSPSMLLTSGTSAAMMVIMNKTKRQEAVVAAAHCLESHWLCVCISFHQSYLAVDWRLILLSTIRHNSQWWITKLTWQWFQSQGKLISLQFRKWMWIKNYLEGRKMQPDISRKWLAAV